jgi:RHS repeat-associated protein
MDILDNGNLKVMDYRHRYYDTYTGRFLQHDPLGITPNPQKTRRIDEFAEYEEYQLTRNPSFSSM